MTRRCVLCGDPCHGAYCHTHEWAAGPEQPDLKESPLPDDAIRITHLHDYWMTRYTPAEAVELAAHITTNGDG